MKIDIKSIAGLIVIVLILSLILILNMKSVGREPKLLSLSKTVAYPGDTVLLKGSHFGGEISKGRIYINDQMLFDSFINFWMENEISITLPDDFRSGMVSVTNMFGSSKSLLITSVRDVPRLKTTSEIPGYPFIESVDIQKNKDNVFNIKGINFGEKWSNSSLLVSYIDWLGEEVFLEVENNRIITWKDDYISFYLPFGLNEVEVYVKNAKGYSNYFDIKVNNNQSLLFELESPRDYVLHQRVSLKNIVALKGSYINLYVPCVVDGGKQKNVVLNSSNGYYSYKSNTFNIVTEVLDSGEEFEYEVETTLTSYSLKANINRTRISRKYDKDSPEYNIGFQKTFGVVETNDKLNGAAKWIVRNNNNLYDMTNLILNWIKKYVKLNNEGSDSSLTTYNNRSGSEEGVVNLSVSMLRAAGIPTRKVKGVIIGDTVKNYSWVEYFLPKLGWIPYDVIENYLNDKYKNGTLEGNRIAFSKGVTIIEYQEDNFKNNLYALQNTVDNSEGNIESYEAVWHNVSAE